MERMRWFVIGNLVGLSLLILGIVGREYWHSYTLTHPSPDPGSHAKSSNTSFNTSSNTSSNTSGNSQTATTPDNTSPSAAKLADQTAKPKRSSPSAVDESSSVPASSGSATVRILAASRDMAKGTKLVAGDVILKDVSPKHAVPHTLTTEEEAFGRTTKVDLVEGELIRADDLVEP